MKKLVFGIICFLFVFGGCGKKEKPEELLTKDTNEFPKKIVGLALGYDGIGDNGFNDMQFKGLVEASKDFDIEIKYKIPENNEKTEMDRILEELVQEGAGLVITSGYFMKESVYDIAKKYPTRKFVLLDDETDRLDNLTHILFQQQEGSFVVGVLAAKVTQTQKIGFIGGVEIAVIKDFLTGFEKGIKYVNSDIGVEVEYCSKLPDTSGFSSPKKGNEIANKMYQEGVDVIYAVAGASNIGIINSAKENDKYVIGVDSDQDILAKGNVLTSMMKRLDHAVYNIIGEFLSGQLKSGIYMYGYKEKGVSITEMKYSREIVNEKMRQEIYDVEEKIVDGTIDIKAMK